MDNGWTGGQYSLFRALLGASLLARFVRAAIEAGPVSPAGLVALAGAAGALALVLGVHDRWAALCLLALELLLTALRARSGGGIEEPFLALLLLVHATLPGEPYGSLDASGRADPAGGWRMNPLLFGAMWVAVAARHSFAGWIHAIDTPWFRGEAIEDRLGELATGGRLFAELLLDLGGPLLAVATWGTMALQLAYLPLALVPRVRPWIWSAHLGLLLAGLAVAGTRGFPAGLFLAQLFTFDPGWIRPRPAPSHSREPDLLFFDGTCGLCHRMVRFVLAEDRSGHAFRFAPLGGAAFRRLVDESRRAHLPDSLVLRRSDGELLVRGAAVELVLRRLGGIWRLVGGALGLLPEALVDRGYDAVARVRKRLFRAPESACPLVPEPLRERFLDGGGEGP